MSGRGPAPKDPAKRARRNAEPAAVVVLQPRFVPAPELPDSFPWPDRTREWWAMWATSPQAPMFTPSDWDFLLDTALLHADVWGNWNLDRLAELRLRVAKFGATPEDRARLRIQFAQADVAEVSSAKVLSARDRFAGMRVEQDRPALDA